MTIDEVIEMLNSEDCKLATSICLMRYRERDCWKCILKEYSKTVYNKAIDDFVNLAKEHDFKHDKKDITNCVIGFIEFFAEQLKEGGNIELSEHSESQDD